MNKPIIGVMPLYDSQKESIWMVPGYMSGLEEHGAITLMLPLTENTEILDYFIQSCDGFLLTGGQDIDPKLYGAERSKLCGENSSTRDFMEQYILKNGINLDKSILGICRGIQIMNAVYGGTLYQDLPSEHGSTLHQMQAPYDRAAHNVNIVKESPLHKLIDQSQIAVNSYHHQAIKELSPHFKSMAVSEDGIIEAIFMPSKKFVWAVQWHPEFWYKTDKYSRMIFAKFVGVS